MNKPSLEHAAVLLDMPLDRDTDVVLCRNRARTIAEALHFDRQQQVKIATAVSEIARNAHRYATGQQAFFCLSTLKSNPPTQHFFIRISDKGPGISALDDVLRGTYRSKTGMGMGIRGAKRLMEGVDIQTSPSGTSVDLWQRLPRGAFLNAQETEAIVTSLKTTAPENPLEELAVQNRDLVATLDQMSAQSMTLEQVNEELRETNRGVVALYDELDTVHRVGRVVASKLDLDSLSRAITDATTELSGAEFGAFLILSTRNERLVWQCVSGPLIKGFPDFAPPDIQNLVLDEDSDIFGLEEIKDRLPFANSLGLQSVLVCPLRDEERSLMGALLLGHRQPNAFTERTERILPTIALQASVGIANAKLYRHVQSANQAKAQFLAVLSHELRTPLNPVFAILTALEENPRLPEDARQDLVVMRRNLQLEATLIDDLLDLTRISEGKLTLKMEAQDLHAIIRAVVHTCGSDIERKKCKVTVDLQAVRHHVTGDEVRLQQALWNLLNNAVKFAPEQSSIVISTSNHDSTGVLVSVTDSGRGIEREALERIFSAFEQGDPLVSAKFGGLGLGLAISKGIVDAHGGWIKADSEGAGYGATFSISLPTISPAKNETTSAPAATPRDAGLLRILMVDDHDDTRMIMSRLLRARGYEVEEAATVAEAIKKFTDGDFELVISDLGLPDGNGHQLMEQLLRLRPVKGIALSGYGMESDVSRSAEAGFLHHLIKPVNFAALDKVISDIARPLGG
jgi:signal transduction histidine kinase